MSRQWFGRWRAVALAGLAVLLVATTVALLVGGGDDDADRDGGPPSSTASSASSAPTTEPIGPDVVARAVIQAVADDDCSPVRDLVATDAVVPSPLAACLAGRPAGAVFTDIRVLSAAVVDDTADVTVAVTGNGTPADITVELHREGDGWVVLVVRPTA
ncbi:hypothetical protein ABFT23_21705 [Nocardioides sp. C4-1]|uniref:hypothetical protein n=1 Tax=Nocardioides sp. C4-1 TaxID=3151851 RepID=UPI003265DB56